MKEKIPKIIRIITVAPLCALALLTALFFSIPELLTLKDYLISILWLVILPLLAYPLTPILPFFRERGRKGQRALAMIMAVLGYIGGIVYAAVVRAKPIIWEIYLTYLISGVLLLVINKFVGIKISGHACGIAGPAAIAVPYLGFSAIAVGVTVYLISLWASLNTKRHSLPEFIGGGIVPVAVFIILKLLENMFI